MQPCYITPPADEPLGVPKAEVPPGTGPFGAGIPGRRRSSERRRRTPRGVGESRRQSVRTSVRTETVASRAARPSGSGPGEIRGAGCGPQDRRSRVRPELAEQRGGPRVAEAIRPCGAGTSVGDHGTRPCRRKAAGTSVSARNPGTWTGSLGPRSQVEGPTQPGGESHRAGRLSQEEDLSEKGSSPQRVSDSGGRVRRALDRSNGTRSLVAHRTEEPLDPSGARGSFASGRPSSGAQGFEAARARTRSSGGKSKSTIP